MLGYARDQRPRQAILGQLPRIHRADGSPIRVLLIDDEPALTNLVKMALHYERPERHSQVRRNRS
jgi:two-component system, OmpR family, response regulator TrcR